MKRLVVCGATGRQGGSVIEAMKGLEGWQLHAFSRDTNSDGARDLKSKEIEVDRADLEDLDSLIRVFKGADCVFGVTQPWNKAYTKCDTHSELKQGKNIVDACKKVDVGYLVLSTAAHMTDEKIGLPQVDIKINIELYAKHSEIPATILKPAQFMDNVGMKFLPVKKGKVRGFIAGDAKVPYIATKDIGIFARAAFENPEEYIGKEVKLIGDFVSGHELAATMSKIRAEKFKYSAVPKWIIWLYSREFYVMRNAFEEFARSELAELIPPEIEKCRRIDPDLMSMEKYLLAMNWDSRGL
jgi:uncharacterized protein YbjT (DUF2867 family)